jgi:hypothetical protein
VRELAAVTEDGVRLNDEQRRRRRARSVAIAVLLAIVAVLFYVVTVVKLGPGAADRPF